MFLKEVTSRKIFFNNECRYISNFEKCFNVTKLNFVAGLRVISNNLFVFSVFNN